MSSRREAPAQTTDSTLEAPPRPAGVDGARVLLAEDTLANQKLIGTILRKAGAEVEVAANGAEAVAMAAAGRFDLVLMDMQMPEMDGHEATAELRGSGFDGPIIALTAQALPGDRQRCIQAGCTDYLAKPVDRAALLATVARELGAPAPAMPPKPEAASSQGPPGEGIRSEFADDPVIAPILDRFVSGLDERTRLMAEALERGDFDGLGQLAHQLKGAGGGYGYPTLTELARDLEQAAGAADASAAARMLKAIEDVCRAVARGRDGAGAGTGTVTDESADC